MGFTVAYGIVITLIFRTVEVRERMLVMTTIFLLSVPLFIAGHLLTPLDLGFLSAPWTAEESLVDLAFALLVYSAGFFGGILQLYNLADRGFSLRILIDIRESSNGCLDASGVVRSYSAGKGIGWMYKKRIDDMLTRGLIVIENEQVVLTPRGHRLVGLFGRLRAYLRLP